MMTPGGTQVPGDFVVLDLEAPEELMAVIPPGSAEFEGVVCVADKEWLEGIDLEDTVFEWCHVARSTRGQKLFKCTDVLHYYHLLLPARLLGEASRHCQTNCDDSIAVFVRVVQAQVRHWSTCSGQVR